MIFEDKVKLLRKLPQFKVSPISEIRAVAFAAKEDGKEGDITLSKDTSTPLFLTPEDVRKITREYPDLEAKLV